MKIKNILLAISISLLTCIGCYAETIKIDNRYENVEIRWKKEYKSKRTSISMNKFYSGLVNIQSNQTDKIEMQIVLNRLRQNEVKLVAKSFNARDQKRSEGQYYDETFTIGDKEGKISYKTKVKYGTRGNGKPAHAIIESIEVKILSLSIDGIEMPKHFFYQGNICDGEICCDHSDFLDENSPCQPLYKLAGSVLRN